MADDTLYQITQGTYQTYRETPEDALEWGRYRAYRHGDDVHVTSTDGEVDLVITRSGLFFRIVHGSEETTTPSQEIALEQARALAGKIDEEIMIYDYNEKLLAKIRQEHEEFYPSERIAVSHDICMGRPTIVGTGILVWVILDMLASGWTAEEIIEDYEEDNITVPDVMACMGYAAKVLRGLTFVTPLP
jgi:uncharacterized protein (DUF433 family)